MTTLSQRLGSFGVDFMEKFNTIKAKSPFSTLYKYEWISWPDEEENWEKK